MRKWCNNLKAVVQAVVLFLTIAAPVFSLQAKRATDFLNSIGVCTHWSYTDTHYSLSYDSVKTLLHLSGIRNNRDGIYLDRPQALGELGIHTLLVADPPNFGNSDEKYLVDLIAKIKTANAAGAKINAIEGPNEPDLFWISFGKTYKGKGFPEGVFNFQSDLYRMIKADPATANITIIGPSLGKTYNPGGGFPNPFAASSYRDIVDWGNFHPYPGGNPFSFPEPYAGIEKYYWHGSQPSGNLEEWPFAFDTYQPPYAPKPMAATETGYSTNKDGISETIHAKYMPRLFLEYFRMGVRRTSSYEFIDEWPDPSSNDRESHFGLIRYDLTPKPAYHAVKNLIQILQDTVTNFTPDSLALQIKVSVPTDHPTYTRTQFVHWQLFQKGNGRFYLAIWHEIANTDNSTQPPRELTQPSMPVTLTLPEIIGSFKHFSLQADGTILEVQAAFTPNYSFSVPDHVQILELIPKNNPMLLIQSGKRKKQSRLLLSSLKVSKGVNKIGVLSPATQSAPCAFATIQGQAIRIPMRLSQGSNCNQE